MASDKRKRDQESENSSEHSDKKVCTENPVSDEQNSQNNSNPDMDEEWLTPASESPDMPLPEAQNRASEINQELDRLEPELEQLRRLYDIAEAMETQPTSVVSNISSQDHAMWVDKDQPTTDEIASQMEEMRANMNSLLHQHAALPTEEEDSKNENSSTEEEDSENENSSTSETNIPAENSNSGNSSVTQQENTVTRGDGSDTDSLYAEPSPNSQVDSQNIEESILLPITCTPVFMILSLFYNFHKMGILYPLLYNLPNYYSALYCYVFEKKQK